MVRFYCIHLAEGEAPKGHTLWPVTITLPNGEWFANAHSVFHAAERVAAHNRAVALADESLP